MNPLGTATYSPEDNKLRLYPVARLAPDVFARVKANGFIWAPKQGLFVAPMWTPSREDLLEELCGEIADEDKSLVERQEERAERFGEYSEKRLADAETARENVAAIADNIPLGQPILIGHHSEKHARKDAERIENGMRKAVKMWETSKYWTSRAAGALAHAKYKEIPAVRARRIKKIEADQRRRQRELDDAVTAHTFWANPELTHAQAVRFSGSSRSDFTMPRKDGDKPDFNQSPSPYTALTNGFPNLYAPRTLAEVVERALAVLPGRITYLSRWILHYENRLAYEKAMLNEQGASHLIAPKARPKQLPLVNYRAKTIHARRWSTEQDFPVVEMTSEDYSAIYSEQRGTLTVENSHRVRFCFYEAGTDGKPRRFANHQTGKWVAVFLTDSKEHKKPGPGEAPKPGPGEAPKPRAPKIYPLQAAYVPPARTEFDDMRDSLKAGVKVVVAPQLFPTPAEIARKMVERAGGIVSGLRVLEPSAGTGALIEAAAKTCGFDCFQLVAVEHSAALIPGLENMRRKWLYATEANFEIVQGDFLEQNGNLGKFDLILMNPPFKNGEDIRHILHALTFLKPGGKCVAICAGGPRQEDKLQPLADSWEPLPDGSFAEQGTGVRTVLAVFSPL